MKLSAHSPVYAPRFSADTQQRQDLIRIQGRFNYKKKLEELMGRMSVAGLARELLIRPPEDKEYDLHERALVLKLETLARAGNAGENIEEDLRYNEMVSIFTAGRWLEKEVPPKIWKAFVAAAEALAGFQENNMRVGANIRTRGQL